MARRSGVGSAVHHPRDGQVRMSEADQRSRQGVEENPWGSGPREGRIKCVTCSRCGSEGGPRGSRDFHHGQYPVRILDLGLSWLGDSERFQLG